MEQLRLNETPVKTSKNFNINNLKLESIVIPDKIGCFNSVEIKGNDSDKIKIDENTSNCNLTYGLGEILTNQVTMKANKKIKITIDSKTNKELMLDFKFNKENVNLVDLIEMVANEGTRATIILKYESSECIEAFHNGVFKLRAKKDSKVNIILVNLMNQNSNNFMAIENNLEENAVVNYTIVDFGGKNSITNYYSNLQGDKCDNQLNTIYLGRDNQLFDLNYIGELRGEKSNINIEVQGALKDKAKKNFKGTIDFKKGCKKATGNENEACMLLSDTAKSIALPMLLCSEEEVEGNHSSSAGKIGEKELFYIMSRGFEQKEAMKLMVKARFNKILTHIKNEELKEKILNEIDRRLD
jgi:Fe-S cluster assembly scaffold protein SufB